MPGSGHCFEALISCLGEVPKLRAIIIEVIKLPFLNASAFAYFAFLSPAGSLRNV